MRIVYHEQGDDGGSEVDKFKSGRTSARPSPVVEWFASGSRTTLEAKHPLTKRKYARTYEPSAPDGRSVPVLLRRTTRVLHRDALTNHPSPEQPLGSQARGVLPGLKNPIQVVVIDLDKDGRRPGHFEP